MTCRLLVDTSAMDGLEVEATLNGIVVDTFTGEDTYIYDGLADQETLVLSVIPEPATLSLLAVGGVGLVRRRRRH